MMGIAMSVLEFLLTSWFEILAIINMTLLTLLTWRQLKLHESQKNKPESLDKK